jgi:hypothetical protein
MLTAKGFLANYSLVSWIYNCCSRKLAFLLPTEGMKKLAHCTARKKYKSVTK